MKRSTLLGTGGLILAVVLLFAVNIVSGTAFSSARLDLTEHRLFTLSDGTRNLLAGLEEPVTMRLYISRAVANQVPGINSYANRVESLLDEYARGSDGRLRVHVIDPEPFSEEEDRAVAYGLRGLPIGTGEDTLYFGLVGTNSTDDEDVIPFLSTDREEFLEYDVTKMIHNLVNPEQPVVGLMSTLPVQGAGPQAALRGMTAPPWMVVEQLGQIFEIRTIETDATAIPEDVDVLVLVHPKALGERTRYAIDQYVLGGGHALVFVDPYAEADRGQPTMPMMPVAPGQSSELDDLLSAWGLSLDTSKIAADIQLAVKVRAQRQARMVTFDYPVWVNLRPAHMNQDDIVTANLGNVAMGSPGHLAVADGAGTTVTPLIRTTDQAALVDAALMDPNGDPEEIVRSYVPGGEPLTLAVRVTGKAKSAFAEAPAAEAGGETEAAAPGAHLAESSGDVNVIVFADTDVLQDRFWVQVQDFLGTRMAIPSAANGSMVINAVDNLEGSSDLISVRNRGSFLRPFERVDELRQEAELAYRAKEQELITRLEEAENRLVELEERKQGEDALVLSPEQQREVIQFRQERLAIRKDLREVRRELRASIESLETQLKFMNIGLVPILIGLGGLLTGLWRMRRRARQPATPA